MKKTLLEKLQESIIIMDGAMGTYYAKKNEGSNEMAEWANKNNPDAVVAIHKEYMEAGASLIRTNTFAINSVVMEIDKKEQKELIRKGYQLAKQAVEEFEQTNDTTIYIAADIGPIPVHAERTEEELLEEYKRICDAFLEEGADIFLFETFSQIEVLKKVVTYIKEQKSTACIITNICVNKNGYTMAGISGKKLLKEIANIEEIGICGYNCGIGSGHMFQLLQSAELPINKKIAVLPNAGYPEQMYNRMVFNSNIQYFAENMNKIQKLGVSLLGGCCGTTPEYIRAVVETCKDNENHIKNKNCNEKCIETSANEDKESTANKEIITKKKEIKVNEDTKNNKENDDSNSTFEKELNKRIQKQNTFIERLESGKKVIAVELDPPYDNNDEKIMSCVEALKKTSADIVTIADSPMGRSRVDSLLMSLKIAAKHEVSVMPHVCCRDKNMIAMRSTLLGAYLNGVRNLLVVTGDPVPSEQRLSTTNVFDYNSIQLMQFIKQMNEEHFADDPIQYGGALNPALGRVDKVVERMKRKIEAGAKYFLTQPIYDEETIEKIHYIKEHVDTKILCGIMPFVSYNNANFIKNEFSGIHVPDEIVTRYSKDMSKDEAEEIGAALGIELVKKLEPYADGYYFMLPFNRVSLFEKMESAFVELNER
ncbi:bifunctional homocysteine S-methyltransferase/methylenetetrahydrofolate reductase [Anaerosporobacter sp.]|uniref:bifunctional homocysteine S-methyltransferase/methylenetetrahydrofolate reductase n=1 Tax=Anaerosporobacter sp. TaxID=1872529 RepID=UPI00286EF74D|nr:bifunctional homocysteine S-methyltransferase/methylenetetrahydrofolate reductase [Anaerosporobacter sp.]